MLAQTSDCVKQYGNYLITPINPRDFHEGEKAAPKTISRSFLRQDACLEGRCSFRMRQNHDIVSLNWPCCTHISGYEASYRIAT